MLAPQLGLQIGPRQSSEVPAGQLQGSPLTRASSLLCFCVSVFAASSCSWDSDKSCLNCRGGTERKKSQFMHLVLESFGPRKHFYDATSSQRAMMASLANPPADACSERDGCETALSHLSHRNPTGHQGAVDSISIQISLSITLPDGTDLLTLGVYNPDRSKHLHLFSPALQSCRSLGHCPNP